MTEDCYYYFEPTWLLYESIYIMFVFRLYEIAFISYIASTFSNITYKVKQ